MPKTEVARPHSHFLIEAMVRSSSCFASGFGMRFSLRAVFRSCINCSPSTLRAFRVRRFFFVKATKTRPSNASTCFNTASLSQSSSAVRCSETSFPSATSASKPVGAVDGLGSAALAAKDCVTRARFASGAFEELCVGVAFGESKFKSSSSGLPSISKDAICVRSANTSAHSLKAFLIATICNFNVEAESRFVSSRNFLKVAFSFSRRSSSQSAEALLLMDGMSMQLWAATRLTRMLSCILPNACCNGVSSLAAVVRIGSATGLQLKPPPVPSGSSSCRGAPVL
mmetsp:Transcript_123908/g.358348  ORF Transcript_123908/g.358348 Transcript_123908/m.358348 type:complete len:284 (-) Transcript_123908:804-1655(-)